MYFLLDSPSTEHPCRWIENETKNKGVIFYFGEKITIDFPVPLKVELESMFPQTAETGPEMPAVFLENVVYFRDDFIEALRECGVNNFDLYPVEIHDPDDGSIHTNYKAVNILGLVKAADLEKSDATVHDGMPLIDVDFDKTVLDETKTHGLELFRLAESITSIMIHERVKNYLVEKGFTHVCFGDLETSAL